ncbi:dymeclin-like [Amphibalanus amphitrite]|uniref:dymeclin-like n=1 Tax=Amphibalanus amphitrite TaxID=1232801 RepID=UPI001C9263B1|nr:dymeclin-like [Amphibalanus amphitrite]
MGAGASDLKSIQDSPELRKFVGEDLIAPNDPFWNQLLGFKLARKLTRNDDKNLESNLQDLFNTFQTNNPKTGNFAALIKIFSLKVTDLKSSLALKCDDLRRETLAAAQLVRQLCQRLVSCSDEEQLVRQCRALPLPDGVPPPAGSDPLLLLIGTLTDMTITLPLQENTYFIHLEALNTLLILLGCQMYTTKPAHELPVYRLLLSAQPAADAGPFVKTLLRRVSARDRAPDWSTADGPDGGGSFTLGLAGGLWSALTLGYSSLTAGGAEETADHWPPVAAQSLLLLLVLGNHCTDRRSPLDNPHRRAMFEMANFHDPAEPQLMVRPHSFRVDFGRLLNALCDLPPSEPASLLLYLLLHKSAAFRTYVLSRTDVDTPVMPTLLTLYRVADNSSSSHQLYMSLIVLLILTEDPLFNRSVHDTLVKSAPWFTERSVTDISVGGLIVLVLVRAIQFNMNNTRDKYLHTNCLAALANMSAEFRQLHPFVCQRLVSLLEQLSRRHSRQLQLLQAQPPPDGVSLQDVTVLEDVVKMLLEIINSCLTAQLAHNPNLVYALLYKREAIQACLSHTGFQDISRNIETVLAHFHEKVASLPKEPGVKEVLAVIQEGVRMFPMERLRKFPELKFKYVEESDPEAFFIPHVWSVVFSGSELHWRADTVCQFDPLQPGAVS